MKLTFAWSSALYVDDLFGPTRDHPELAFVTVCLTVRTTDLFSASWTVARTHADRGIVHVHAISAKVTHSILTSHRYGVIV